MASSSSPSSAATRPGGRFQSSSSRPETCPATTTNGSTGTCRRSSRKASTAAISSWPRCASWWRPASPVGNPRPDGEDPARRGQRDEPRHALSPPRPARVRRGHRGRRRARRGHGAVGGAGADPDGHEPSGAGRVGSDPSDQGHAGDARHSGDRAHRACHVRRPRESHRSGLRRLRHQARRPRPADREDRGAARAGRRRMSIDPAAQLRHELRTPLNHIIGYTELLLEELEDGGKPDLTAGFAALRADARQLLALLNEVLARGQAGPPDLAAARGTLGPPLERIRSAGEALRRRASESGAGALIPDLDRICTATERLDVLLGPGGGPVQESAQQAASAKPGTAQPAQHRAAILVVDDNEDNRDMLARRLRRQGYEVLTAVGGRAALDSLGERPLDLVLLDVMMPDLDGYAVLKQLKADPVLRDIPILMISALAETAEPEEVMGVLREYHGEMGRLILDNEGTLERFTGDGMMIFFNDPVEIPNPAERAVRMAIAMRDLVGGLAARWRKRGWDLSLGVGITQGYATIGAIGFEGRMDYGAIGTVTNLAARLCSEATGGQILISARVAGAVESLIEAEDVGPLTLKGLARPVPVWSVRGLR